MSRLEDELRDALRREEPSAGFTERVLTRARKPRWSFAALFGGQGMRWAAAAALALVLLGAGFEYRQHRERERGEAARAQVLLALHIAGSKLQFAQAKVQQVQGPNDRQYDMEKVQ